MEGLAGVQDSVQSMATTVIDEKFLKDFSTPFPTDVATSSGEEASLGRLTINLIDRYLPGPQAQRTYHRMPAEMVYPAFLSQLSH